MATEISGMKTKRRPLLDPQTITAPIKAEMAARTAQEVHGIADQASAARIILAALNKASSIDRAVEKTIRHFRLRHEPGA